MEAPARAQRITSSATCLGVCGLTAGGCTLLPTGATAMMTLRFAVVAMKLFALNHFGDAHDVRIREFVEYIPGDR
jgi:hypothetical protein